MMELLLAVDAALGLTIRWEILAISWLSSCCCFLLTTVAWFRKGRSMPVGFMAMLFLGLAISSSLFGFRYATGVGFSPHGFSIANLASVLISIGGFGWCFSLFRRSR